MPAATGARFTAAARKHPPQKAPAREVTRTDAFV
jgi:hypothetical protein